MSFWSAANAAMAIGMLRKHPAAEAAGSYAFSRSEAAISTLILVVVQASLMVWSFWPLKGIPVEVIRDTGLVVALSLVIPYIVYWVAARVANATDKVAGAFVYLGLLLAFAQVAAAVASNFGQSTSVILGLVAVAAASGATGFFGFGRGGATLIGVAIFLAMLGAGLLLLVLPGGRMLLG